MAEIRVSSAERADALAALGEHHSNGRLTPSEYELRCRRATDAVLRPELEALFDDLPAPHPDLSTSVAPRRAVPAYPEWPGGRERSRATRVLDAVGVLALLVGLPTAIVLTVAAGLWWTILVAVGVAVLAMVLGIAFTKDVTEGAAES
ncbi:DUF1707 SHOCT-like domain-containing protein [Actinophytocola gossypii]|uniref:DUF1707 domain-containing protein n=1 Tax=Actinophytocola gossypii TaxID=2812003 RepID=A0ABT2JE88_9PSEU|nr:DUF1707 domain-containing protein [Actinophytocola gossypii]MCT2586187.1 DUF1707 domain-containing protein [Actinophytocola gossypii]